MGRLLYIRNPPVLLSKEEQKMNREQAAKLLPIIQAIAEGKDYQWKNRSDAQWTSPRDGYSQPHIDSSSYEWRIKPEVKEGWIGISHSGYTTPIHSTQESALAALKASRHSEDACIKITYTEGEGL
jgi:hypothetical protein